MGESPERCLNCPERSDASRVFGKLIRLAQRTTSRGRGHTINESEACPGPTPLLVNHYQPHEHPDTSMDLYIGVCPRNHTSTPEVPPEATQAICVTGLRTYLHHIPIEN